RGHPPPGRDRRHPTARRSLDDISTGRRRRYCYYRQALALVEVAEEPPEEAWRIDVLIALGEAEHHSGEPGYRPVLREAAERAERLGDADRLARAGLAGLSVVRWDRALAVETERVMVLE